VQSNYGERRSRVHPFAWAILAVIAVAIFSLIALVAIRGYPTPPAYSGYPMMGGWFFWPFGIVVFFLFLFLIFRFIFWGWGGGGWRRRYWPGYGYGDAREILRQRYARGEISKEQFDQMTRDLEQSK